MPRHMLISGRVGYDLEAGRSQVLLRRGGIGNRCQLLLLRAQLGVARARRCPGFDLCSSPQHRSLRSQVDDRARHAGVAALVEANAVGLRESEDLSDTAGIDQVLRSYERAHDRESTAIDSVSGACARPTFRRIYSGREHTFGTTTRLMLVHLTDA